MLPCAPRAIEEFLNVELVKPTFLAGHESYFEGCRLPGAFLSVLSHTAYARAPRSFTARRMKNTRKPRMIRPRIA